MVYLVSARKWRPQRFEDVVGQEHVRVTLQNALREGKVAHAYLFAGPRGVGKTTVARVLAKALNCEQGPTPTPCNACAQCLAIARGRSMDVLEIDGASNRGIDEVRELRESAQLAPVGGRYKVYIIDEVHMLTTPAFNALLKTLEEPPSHVVFVLATTEPHQVPPTIRSRCQRFDFRRLSVREIVEHLAFISRGEKVEAEEAALVLMARKAEGSMRDAQSLWDQAAAFGEGRVSLRSVQEMLGLVEGDLFFRVGEAILRGEVRNGLEVVEEALDRGISLGAFAEGLAEHLRNLLVVKVGGEGLDLLEEEVVRLREQAALRSEEDIARLLVMASDLASELPRSPSPRLRLEVGVVRMTKALSSMQVEDVLSRLNRLEAQLGGEGEPEPSDKTQGSGEKEEKAPSEGPDIEALKGRWEEVAERVGRRSPRLGAFLREGCPQGFEDGVVEVAFGTSFHRDAVHRQRRVVEEVLREVFGRPIRVRAVRGEAEKKPYGDDPMLQKVIELFDGEIVHL
ncbi:MAG TPA: DNA polymerase III subunit gamma/tau [Candidatus Latescibacteria bacterium]|nr:DNA polymerase III subunit gamma/tau [Candidatus Latescibacterota bacterium]